MIGTFGQVPTGTMTLVETVADVERLPFAGDAKLAFLTQTTLSVDDTAEVIAALEARRPRACWSGWLNCWPANWTWMRWNSAAGT